LNKSQLGNLEESSDNASTRLGSQHGAERTLTCNLRFFLKSIRHSEDMDLDIHTLVFGSLQNDVNRHAAVSSRAPVIEHSDGPLVANTGTSSHRICRRKADILTLR
jgi:hypothetical protein